MRLAAALLVATVLGGCAQAVPDRTAAPPAADRALVTSYFAAVNEAARQGSAAQQRFLDDTQHPDFRHARCPLDGLTLEIEPAMTTLRPDPEWTPPGADAPPRGSVYVVAVTVTMLDENVEVAEQIGSQHVVVLNGTAYGFAACPA